MTNVLVDFQVRHDSLERLRSLPGITIECIEPEESARSLPPELIRDKHILLCETPPVNFSNVEMLEFIQITSSGYSQLFNLGLVERQIRACNARGVFDVPIAEWNIAMMVNLARDLRGIIRNQQAGAWDRAARFQREIRGSLVGLWGYGSVGRETARLAKALGLRVHVLQHQEVGPRVDIYTVLGTGDPQGALPDQIFMPGQEMAFLSDLDYLILAMPLTQNTEGIVGESELKALPKHAYLLNPARGPLVQEQALISALQEGWIAGAALDTHHHYPMPPDHPLWKLPNVIMTPHISGSSLSQHFVDRIWDLFLKNVQRYLSHQPLLNELTAEQLNGG